MRYSKATLILSTFGAFASMASAQSFSGSVDNLCNVSGGSTINRNWAVLAPGQNCVSLRLDNAGPGVTGFGQSLASPGLLMTSRDISSAGIPYGQSWGKATYRDAVRWTGTAPITVRVCARLAGDLWVGGSNPMQTDSSVYANFGFFADGYSINQTMQRGKTVEGTWDTTRGGIADVIVTLQPGKWYTFTNTLQVNGDASDQTKPISSTFSSGSYSLKTWFQHVSGGGVGTLQSGSGHDYTVEPVLPAVQ
ncbi:hypothetical protein EON82_07245 [bacterium]|nr:MAG: hypothetical protein EON82_07245 [bacterium]